MKQIFTIGNGEDLNKLYSDTFNIPSLERRNSLQINDLLKVAIDVKINISEDEFITIHTGENDLEPFLNIISKNKTATERMWCIVTEIFKDGYKVKLDNDSYFNKDVRAGLEFNIEYSNIIDIG